MEEWVAQVIDKDGVVWEYEGHIQSIPIWVENGQSCPRVMSEDEANAISSGHAKVGEIANARML